MKNGGGKRKGSNFERDICKKLTFWVSGKEKPYIFWRSPSSGAVATISQSTNISGDIISVMPEGAFFTDKFSIECKDGYADADLFKHFKGSKNEVIETFWTQCIRDSRMANKEGILIFRRKGFPILIGIEKMGILYKIVYERIERSITVNYENNLPVLVLYDFDTFICNIKPNEI